MFDKNMERTYDDLLFSRRLNEKAGYGDTGRGYTMHAPRIVQPLRPYFDGEIRTEPTRFTERRNERKTEVDDRVLDDYVRRILLTASIDATETNETQKQKIKPEPVPGHLSPKKRERKNKRRGRKIERQDPQPGEFDMQIDQTVCGPTITMLQSEYRRMVCAELQSRARNIHDYYAAQWDFAQIDKMDVYTDALTWKDKFLETDRKFKNADKELTRLKKEYSQIQTELDTIKANKRRRKKDAKQRKTQVRMAEISVSDPGTVDQEKPFSPMNLCINEIDGVSCPFE